MYKWCEFIAFTSSLFFGGRGLGGGEGGQGGHTIRIYVNCISRIVLYMRIEHCVWVNMYHVIAQGVDERVL